LRWPKIVSPEFYIEVGMGKNNLREVGSDRSNALAVSVSPEDLGTMNGCICLTWRL
jgi:hypothetical protein